MDALFIFLVLIAFLVIMVLSVAVHRMKERIDSLESAQYNIVEQFNEHKVKCERTALYVGKHQAYIEAVQKKKMQIAEKKSQNANKRRDKYNELRNGGMTQAEARKELGISVSTSKRYEKWRKANAK